MKESPLLTIYSRHLPITKNEKAMIMSNYIIPAALMIDLLAVVPRHGGRRPTNTSFVVAISEDVDADPGLRSGQALRRHDDEGYRSGVGTSGHCIIPGVLTVDVLHVLPTAS